MLRRLVRNAALTVHPTASGKAGPIHFYEIERKYTMIEKAVEAFSCVLARGDGWGSLNGNVPVSPELAFIVKGQLAAWYAMAAPQEVAVPWFVEWLNFCVPSGLWECQEGYRYSVGQPGAPATDWEPAWVVVGDCSGDPVIVDTKEEDCPVLMAVHGRGTWAPRVVAPSLAEFLLLLTRWLEVWLQAGGQIRGEDGGLLPSVLDAALGPVDAALSKECRENFMCFVG